MSGRIAFCGAVVALTLCLLTRLGAAAEVAPVLRARASSEGSVRVIVRLAVPEAASAARGTPADDDARRRAISAAAGRLGRDLGSTGWAIRRRFRTLPFVALEVSPAGLDRLSASGAVAAVAEDRLERPALAESVPLVQADQVQALGYDGSGWTVAVLDTGVDGSHSFLAGKVVSEACYSANGSCPNGETSQLGAGAGRPCDWAPSACVHGTHVAGVIAGSSSELTGVAPGASLIAIQVFSRFTGSTCDGDVEDPCALTFTSDTIAGLERVYELRDQYRIAAVNLSLGGGRFFSETGCDLDDAARKAAVDQLLSVVAATIAAAGNEGTRSALSAPACVSSVVSVGATTKGDQVALFSNSAPFLDLLAPGVAILSSIPPDDFALISGTSQATPHVSGAYALLSQALGEPAPDRILTALRATGVPVFDPRNGLTVPRIAISDALAALLPSPSSGVQQTLDGKRTLVSKDVGGERWAITRNPEDGTVTGNVFRTDGGEPQFVWCRELGDDGKSDPYEIQVRYECSGAGTCDSLACPAGQWQVIAEVTLPGSFFLPPREGDAPAGAAPPSTSSGTTPAASGLQITPDGKRTLVSKDVGGDRWSITQNLDDGTVTGNVFPLDGGEPSFVFCQPIGSDGSPDPFTELTTYACYGAGSCAGEPCGPEEWSFVSNVTLPGSFFLP